MSDAYRNESILWAYAKWHYGTGVRELVSVAGNFLWFVGNFFSFRLLARTLFAPWKRMGETYGEGFDFERIAGSFIVNSLMRAVGFATRAVVLVVGLASYLAMLAFCLALFLIWLLAPIFLMGSLLLSATFFVV